MEEATKLLSLFQFSVARLSTHPWRQCFLNLRPRDERRASPISPLFNLLRDLLNILFAITDPFTYSGILFRYMGSSFEFHVVLPDARAFGLVRGLPPAIVLLLNRVSRARFCIAISPLFFTIRIKWDPLRLVAVKSFRLFL